MFECINQALMLIYCNLRARLLEIDFQFDIYW